MWQHSSGPRGHTSGGSLEIASLAILNPHSPPIIGRRAPVSSGVAEDRHSEHLKPWSKPGL